MMPLPDDDFEDEEGPADDEHLDPELAPISYLSMQQKDPVSFYIACKNGEIS